MKKKIGKRVAEVGSAKMNVRVRSAQWFYWNRLNKDLWVATGDMLRRLAE